MTAETVTTNGMVAEFEEEEALVAAVQRAYAEGYRAMDAFTPYPVEAVSDAMNFKKTKVPLLVLAGGVIGLVGGFFMQYWINVIAYPHNIAGRPYNSWPAFIPVTFETTILLAALFAVIGLFALNGLPQPYHSLFNVPEFAHASQDRFFLHIEAKDALFDSVKTRDFLESLKPSGVYDVPV